MLPRMITTTHKAFLSFGTRSLFIALMQNIVTSANIHEQATPESVPSVLASLDGRPDIVIDGGIRKVVPSTLVNCNLPIPAVEREGVISRQEIEQVLS